MAGFTDKMGATLAAYAKCRNKTRAYRSVYDCTNCNPQTVRRDAYELFRHPLMVQAVAQMEATAAATIKIDAAWVLKRAALLADFNIEKFICIDEAGVAVYDFSEATDDDWYCISEYTVDIIWKGSGDRKYEVERVKLKSESRIRALELCGKHVDVQAFREQIEHSGIMGIAQLSTDEYKEARQTMLADDDC